MLSVVNQRMENFDARAKAETEATLSVIADAMTAEGIDSTATATATALPSVPDKLLKSITDGKEVASVVAVDEEHSDKKPLSEVTEVKAGEPSNAETAELKDKETSKPQEER